MVRAHHILVAMVVGAVILRLVVVVRGRPKDRWEELKWYAGGWLEGRIRGVRVSAILVGWVVACVAAAAVTEWLHLR